MKKILVLIFLFIPVFLKAQDYEAWELPEYTTVANDSTDVLYIDDSGVDKHVEMPAILNVINDTADVVRQQLIDTAAAIRAGIGGGSIWDRTGNKVALHTSGDSLGIGINPNYYKFEVNGNSKIYGSLFCDTLFIFGYNGYGGGWLTSYDDDLYIGDNNNSATSLTSLTTGLFTRAQSGVNYTYYSNNPLYHWRFGGTGYTSYMMHVGGTLYTSSDIYDNGNLYFSGVGGLFGSGHPYVYSNTSDTLYLSDESGTYKLSTLASGGTGVDTAAVIGLFSDMMDTTEFAFNASQDAVADTLLSLYNGDIGYWINPWLKSGSTLRPNADTIQFNDGSQLRRSTNGVQIFPYNTGGRAIEFKDVNSKAMLNTTVLELSSTDTTYGAAGRMVYKTNGKYYGYDATTSTWTEFGEGGGGAGTVTTSGSPANTYLTYFSSASEITGTSKFSILDATLRIVNSSDTGMTIINTSAAPGLYLTTADGDGVTGVLSGSGDLIQGTNVGTGNLLNLSAATGNAINVTDGSNSIFTVDGDSVYLHYLGMSASDTVAILAIGANERLDSASLTPVASRAWIDRIIPFKMFFWKSRKEQSLPLPYPDGTERRKMNAMYQSYQTEYELERAEIYINRLWNWLFIVSIICGLLIAGFFYQQVQIRKLKK